ncbi:phage virion morphogenesis protein [Yersinia enterocolitica]|uniref:phage virion morphogenesis protein n=1 Tax=Yersinia enterocolitica TaxID=630 RepID=UPI0002EB1500|nr:phage virion morphogenesis protein [Yersinia enterocolitica]
MNELKPFDDALAGLIASLTPKARKALAATVAKRLRASQQQRIKRQQAPDGTPYAARKSQPLRKPKGRIKREMFAKLRTARYMKANNNPNEAVVEFAGRVERMAAVHHFGLRDRPASKRQTAPRMLPVNLNRCVNPRAGLSGKCSPSCAPRAI